MFPTKKSPHIVIEGDCTKELLKLYNLLKKNPDKKVHLTFFDPPFNQGKEYRKHNDYMKEEDYWNWMKEICKMAYQLSEEGAAIFFMQREKNVKEVITVLEETGWTFQNLIIWKKLTSAVPQKYRFGKQFQIIVFATKGQRPRVFNRVRIDLPIEPHHKYERENGVYATDLWTDIRELTAGYFAGDEALRNENNERIHKQQSPVALLVRIILASTKVNDVVLDPFAGSGTTAVVCKQLQRDSINIELDQKNIKTINMRLSRNMPGDNISKLVEYYKYTQNLKEIWPNIKDKLDNSNNLKKDSSLENFIKSE